MQEDETTIVVSVDRDVKKGEQLFVMYDGFMQKHGLETRRKRLKRWLDDDCQCSRCVREEAELALIKQGEGCDISLAAVKASWDTSEKPVLPEDLEPKLE